MLAPARLLLPRSAGAAERARARLRPGNVRPMLRDRPCRSPRARAPTRDERYADPAGPTLRRYCRSRARDEPRGTLDQPRERYAPSVLPAAVRAARRSSVRWQFARPPNRAVDRWQRQTPATALQPRAAAP